MWRLIAAAALLAVAFGGLPSFPGQPKPDATPVDVTPSPGMMTAVADVKTQLSKYPRKERALWTELWTEVAKVATDPITAPTIHDTPTLRAYQVEMLRIGWLVLGDHAPGANPALDVAVSAAFGATLTGEERPVTPEVLAQYAELAKALAWAGR